MKKMVANCRTPYADAGEVFEMTADEIRDEGGNIEHYLETGVLEEVTGVEAGDIMPNATRDVPPVAPSGSAEPSSPVGGPGTGDDEDDSE